MGERNSPPVRMLCSNESRVPVHDAGGLRKAFGEGGEEREHEESWSYARGTV